MPRKSLVHYIAPSAISITPNCNESANDLAVSLVRGAKIKVYSPDAGIGTDDGNFQEWTLYGRNRRLADSAGSDGHRYTIYARLPKANKDGGYLVFAQMTKDEDDEWVDKYWHVTSKGYSRRDDNRLDEDFDPDDPPQTDEDEKKMQKNNWWFRLGEVSEPSGGQRTVTLDTGILGTDQFNTEWNLVQEGLHVDLTCRLLEPYTPDPEGEVPEPEGEDAGPTPYVPWGYWLRMQAELAGVRDDEVVEVKKWEITRSTGAGSIDWLDDEDPRKEYFEKEGKIILSHTRGEEGTDDFEAAVSLVFTVTAWGTKRERTDKDDEEEEQEPVVVVQDGDEGEEGDDGEILAMATITIMSETNEQYALQLSETIVNYDDDEEEFRPETVTVRVRSTDQRSGVTDITTGQMAAACLAVQYALADDLDTWIPLEFDDNTDDPDNPFAEAFIGGGEESVFYEGQNIIVRLVMTEQEEGREGFTVVKELSRKTILNYYNLDAKYVTVGFFRKLFAVHHIGDDGNDEIIETNRKIKDEGEDPTVNIEAKRGFWSPSYVSALGQGSNAGGGGGGGGGDSLEWPLQDINNADMPRNPSIGDTIVWNGSTFTWSAGLDTTKLATWLQSNDYKKQADLDLRYLRLRSDTVQTVQSQLLLTGNVAISGATLTIAHPQGFDPKEAADNVVLTKGETATVFDERYVTINWFKKLFEARTQGGTAVDPNKDGIIDNLKVLVGTWTEQYVSALGTGSLGGGGGTALEWPLLDINNANLSRSPSTGDTIVYDPSVPGKFKWGAGLDTTKLATWLQSNDYKTKSELDLLYLTDAKLKSQYSWWGQRLNANNVVTGTITVGDGDIILNNNRKVSWKKATGDASYPMLTVDGNNNFIVGETTITNQMNTYVRGSIIRFQLASGRNDAELTIPAGDTTPTFCVKKLKIGGIVISEDTTNGGLHVESAGIYADTYVSALGTGSQGGAGGLDLELMWDSLTNATADAYANTKINNRHLNLGTLTINGQTWKPTDGNKTITFDVTSTIAGATDVANYFTGTVARQAAKLSPGRKINGTSFTGEADITTASWGTKRTVTVKDADGTNSKANANIDGSADFDLLLPSTIKASLTGNASTATKLQSPRMLWGNTFDGSQSIGYYDTSAHYASLSYVQSISMNGAISGATGIDTLMYFFTADSNKQVKITSATSGSALISPTDKGSYQRGGSTYYPRLFVNGNVGVTNELWVGGVDFAGASGHGGYIDFNYGGQYANDFSTRIIESAAGVLGIKRYSGATGLVVGNSTNGDHLKIGGATLTWVAGQGLKIDTGFWSESFVSALGTGSGGSGGGIDMSDVWSALAANDSNHKINNSHINLNTLTINVDGTAYTYNGQSTQTVVITTGGGTSTDTKNTAGALDNHGTKLYLIGASEQAANPVTYTNSGCYIDVNGNLYSNSSKTVTETSIGSLGTNIGVAKANSAIFVSDASGGKKVGLNADNNRGVYDWTASKWLVGSNGTNTWLSIGNVGIGTSYPDYKLHVSGNAAVNSLILGQDDGIRTYSISTKDSDACINLSADSVHVGASSIPSSVTVSPKFYVNGIGYFSGDLYSNGKKVLTEGSGGGGTDNDTKDTAGIYPNTDSKKLYLIGSQTGPSTTTSYAKTYASSGCYIGTDGCLYSASSKVLTEAATGFVPTTGGSMSGHLYLTGAQASSSTGNTSQIVFGTSSSNHVAISSNTDAVIINPSTGSTTNQIILGVNGVQSVFNGTLRVKSAVTFDSTLSVLSIGTTSIANASAPLAVQNNSQNLQLGGSNNHVGIGVAADNNYKLKVSGTTLFDGRVGIGGLNSETATKLYVSGKATITGDFYAATDFMIRKVTNPDNSYYYTIGINQKTVSAQGTWQGTFTSGSDIRQKDVIQNREISLEDIARTPIFEFTWKDRRDTKVHLGTSAQYIDSILPSVVYGQHEDSLSMDYGATALAYAVTAARTVLSHEERIKALEERIKAQEQENRQLKNEIELLKAA